MINNQDTCHKEINNILYTFVDIMFIYLFIVYYLFYDTVIILHQLVI